MHPERLAIQPASEVGNDGLEESPADPEPDPASTPASKLSVRERSRAKAAADSANSGILGYIDAHSHGDDGLLSIGAMMAAPVPAGLHQIDEEDEVERAIEATLAPMLQPPSSGVDDRNV
jgi:hypothetical protein